MLRRAVLGVSVLALAHVVVAFAQNQELLPYDNTVTLVVDQSGLGDFTTITAAINQVKANNDASPDKRYSIQIVPSPISYDECVDLSGLRYTEISGLEGRARIDFTGSGSPCGDSGADIVGCNSSASSCRSVTVRNLSAGGIEIGSVTTPAPQDNANYGDLVIRDVVVERDDGTAPFLRIATCHDPMAECSFTIDRVMVRSDGLLAGSIEVTSTASATLARSAHARGAIRNSSVYGASCSANGLLKVGPLGASQDSAILISGNTFVCDDMGVTQGSQGVGLVAVAGDPGSIRFEGNQFVATLRTDTCGAGGCEHAAIRGTGGGVSLSEAFVQGNTFEFVLKAPGMVGDSLAFLDLGAAASPAQNQEWNVSGNDFRVVVEGSDFSLDNARDLRLRDAADASKVRVRGQDLRYGVRIDPGSTSTIEGWPSYHLSSKEANVVDRFAVPTSPPGPTSSANGHVWVATTVDDLCFRSGGRQICVDGRVAPCGDGTCASGENPCNCSQDCGTQQTPESSCADGIDNDCDGAADGADSDCVPPNPCDGDLVCEAGEDCHNCISDCDGKLTGPITKQFCCGNGVLEGPEGPTAAVCDGNK